MNTRSKRVAGNSSAPITEEPRRKAPKRQRIEEPENDELEMVRSQLATQKQEYVNLLVANNKMEKELESTKPKLAAEKKKNSVLLDKHKRQLAKMEKDKKIEIHKATLKQNEENKKLLNLLDHKCSELSKQKANTAASRKEVRILKQELKDIKGNENDEPFDWKCCEICCEQYSNRLEKTPRLLGCGHTFCLECVRKIAENSVANTVTCPFDRTEFKMGTKQPKDLPKNFAHLNVLNNHSIGF